MQEIGTYVYNGFHTQDAYIEVLFRLNGGFLVQLVELAKVS